MYQFYSIGSNRPNRGLFMIVSQAQRLPTITLSYILTYVHTDNYYIHGKKEKEKKRFFFIFFLFFIIILATRQFWNLI